MSFNITKEYDDNFDYFFSFLNVTRVALLLRIKFQKNSTIYISGTNIIRSCRIIHPKYSIQHDILSISIYDKIYHSYTYMTELKTY